MPLTLPSLRAPFCKYQGMSSALADPLAGRELGSAKRGGVPRLAAAFGAIGLWWWWRLHPTPRPFAQRLWIDAPHPFVTQRRLREVLAPAPGRTCSRSAWAAGVTRCQSRPD